MELMHILITAINAVVPIVLLIAFGYWLRQREYLTDHFLSVGMKLVFDYLLPASLFVTAYKIESFSSIPWDIAVYCVVMPLVLFFLGMAVTAVTTKDPLKKGPLVQIWFRSNTAIIGISLAEVLGGQEAVAVAAIAIAFTLPMFNMLAVLALSIYLGEEGQKADYRKILKGIVTNPLIRAIALGLLCLGIRTWQINRFGHVVFSLKRDVTFLYSAIEKAGSVASSFALIVLGGQFKFSASGELKKEIIVGTMARCVIAPAITLGLAYLLSTFTPLMNCGTNEYPALIGAFATPAAVSSAIMAGRMGSDQQLATQLVVWTSLCSIATMFLSVCILMSAGLLIL